MTMFLIKIKISVTKMVDWLYAYAGYFEPISVIFQVHNLKI